MVNVAADQLRFWLSRDPSMVLSTLEQHPVILQEKLLEDVSVLETLLMHQVPLEIFLRVLELPQVELSDPFLLHVACANHNGSINSLELIQVLAEALPTAISTPDSTGQLPLHHAFKSGLGDSSGSSKCIGDGGLATVQFLVDLFPASIWGILVLSTSKYSYSLTLSLTSSSTWSHRRPTGRHIPAGLLGR